MHKGYTKHVTNGMRVRHDAKARFAVKSGNTILEDRLVDAETLGGAVTVASIMYNRSSMSGGTSWWNPETGQPIARPKFQAFFRPEDILKGDELCTCPKC